MIAQTTDLWRLHDIGIAKADPNVMPENYPIPEHYCRLLSSPPLTLLLFEAPLLYNIAAPRRKIPIGLPGTVLILS
jgi:hypothetical protein